MAALAVILGIAWADVVAVDVFVTIVLPRRVAGRFRLTVIFYRISWRPWSFCARHMRDRKRREAWLSVYGPLSLLLLLAMWTMALSFAFALMHWGMTGAHTAFRDELLASSMNLVDLAGGWRDAGALPFLTVLESGSGLGLLALVIGYLPVVYQSFSRREANITLLDAR